MKMLHPPSMQVLVLWVIPAMLILAIGATGCRASQAVVIGIDDLGRKIVLSKVPERLVVLSSSCSLDTIFELGAGDKIVGVMDNIEASYPETCRRYPSLLDKPRVGRFNTANMEKIVEINPDLILLYASADHPEKNTALFEAKGLPYAAFSTVENLAFGLEQIKRLGILIGKEKEAEALSISIKYEIETMAQTIAAQAQNRPRVYFWWGQRNGTYGHRAAIHQLIEMAGGTNITGEFDRQYMEISPEYIISQDPEVIIISYWQEKQRAQRLHEIVRRPGFDHIKAVRNNRIQTIDGHDIHTTIRFTEALRNLVQFIHPELSERVAE